MIFVRNLLAQSAFIRELQTKEITLQGGGAIQSENFLQGQEGFRIRANGNVEFHRGTIGGVDLNANSIRVQGKGYLPVGFVYFQLRGQPEPAILFAGVWENISSQYAGLFFRAEGGNAVAFGQNQGANIQPHIHRYEQREFFRYNLSNISGMDLSDASPRRRMQLNETQTNRRNIDTESTGQTETRPVNTTIRVWIRRS